MSKPTALALLGNPGVGKSTILNGCAGSPVFKSGLSLGSGLTTELKYYQTSSYLLCDSAGLADISKSADAARQLDELLATAVPIKLAFVVTLDQGRVKPQDAKTIGLVLSALSGLEVNDSFGVIINQVSPSVKGLISSQPGAFTGIKRQLLGSRYTSHWIVVAQDKTLQDKSNGMLMTPELKEFLDELPVTKPEHATAKRVKQSDMPIKLAPRQWTWADALVKIKVPQGAELCWAPLDWTKGWYRVYGPAAVVLELKWVWSSVQVLATSSK